MAFSVRHRSPPAPSCSCRLHYRQINNDAPVLNFASRQRSGMQRLSMANMRNCPELTDAAELRRTKAAITGAHRWEDTGKCRSEHDPRHSGGVSRNQRSLFNDRSQELTLSSPRSSLSWTLLNTSFISRISALRLWFSFRRLPISAFNSTMRDFKRPTSASGPLVRSCSTMTFCPAAGTGCDGAADDRENTSSSVVFRSNIALAPPWQLAAKCRPAAMPNLA